MMFCRWLNLGASPFLLFHIETYILQFDFKIFTLYQASAGRDEIRRRFFWVNKNFSEFFFTGSLSGSGPEIHFPCYQLWLFINDSLQKRVLDFKIQKDAPITLKKEDATVENAILGLPRPNHIHGLGIVRPRTSSRPAEACYKVKILKSNCKI